ncbi:MAG: nif-specific transcriptional activator NifA [Mangrovicoccus sp.]
MLENTQAQFASHSAATPREDSYPLDAVYESAKLLAGSGDLFGAFHSVLNVLSSFMGLKQGTVVMLAEGDALEIAKSTGANPYIVAATTRAFGETYTSGEDIPDKAVQRVFSTGMGIVSFDVETEFGAECLPSGHDGESIALISTPIRDVGQSPYVLGVISVYRNLTETGRRHLDDDQRVLSMIASLIAQALQFRRTVARDRERLVSEARRALSRVDNKPEPNIAEIPQEIVTPLPGIVGHSRELSHVIATIRKVAVTSAPVLLRGESGTGKELFARAIHALSRCKDGPFIKVNCAALSETLLETELFGHEKGSFTGAVGQKKGRFELADGGTLFLDEIGEIGPEFQAKLLRVLQEGEFERVGGTKTLKVNVRLVTATNKDLEEAVAKGDFRADLYFRICVIPVVLPPLRERPTDIPLLAQRFLDDFNRENEMELVFDKAALNSLCACQFPGNVRELENCVNRVAAMSSGPVITATELACHQNACLSAELWRLQSDQMSPVGGLARTVTGQVESADLSLPVIDSSAPPPVSADTTIAPRKTANTEREALVDAMERAGWVQAKAARLLGMTPRQIGYALKKHKIEVQKF